MLQFKEQSCKKYTVYYFSLRIKKNCDKGVCVVISWVNLSKSKKGFLLIEIFKWVIRGGFNITNSKCSRDVVVTGLLFATVFKVGKGWNAVFFWKISCVFFFVFFFDILPFEKIFPGSIWVLQNSHWKCLNLRKIMLQFA